MLRTRQLMGKLWIKAHKYSTKNSQPLCCLNTAVSYKTEYRQYTTILLQLEQDSCESILGFQYLWGKSKQVRHKGKSLETLPLALFQSLAKPTAPIATPILPSTICSQPQAVMVWKPFRMAKICTLFLYGMWYPSLLNKDCKLLPFKLNYLSFSFRIPSQKSQYCNLSINMCNSKFLLELL